MLFEKRIIKRDDGYEYEILQDGSVMVRQDYMPNVEGFVSMTEATANELADRIVEDCTNGTIE